MYLFHFLDIFLSLWGVARPIFPGVSATNHEMHAGADAGRGVGIHAWGGGEEILPLLSGYQHAVRLRRATVGRRALTCKEADAASLSLSLFFFFSLSLSLSLSPSLSFSVSVWLAGCLACPVLNECQITHLIGAKPVIESYGVV